MERSLKRYLFNPFEFIAGTKALFIGLCVILITGLISYFCNIHIDGVIDMHFGAQAPLYIHLIEGLIDWLCLSIILYLAGVVLSATKIRMIDVFGTLALARWPMIINVLFGFFVSGERVGNFLLYKFLKQGEAVVLKGHEMPVFIIFSILSLLFIIWMIALFWKAYTVSCNLKGPKAVISFIIGLLLAEVFSKFILTLIYETFR